MYFRLNPESLLVVGANGAVICDAFNNKIYHLNDKEKELIVKAENNNEILISEEFYHILKKECLGNFYKKIPYIQKVRLGSAYQSNKYFNFNKFFLELTDKCDFNCCYCGFKNEDKRSKGCLGCNSIEEDGEYLSRQEFYEIIDTVSNLGCDELYITGGDLSLDVNFSKDIIEYANLKIPNIFIILSYNHNFIEFLDLIGDNLHLILQIDLEDYDSNLLNNENIEYLVVVPEGQEKIFYKKRSNNHSLCIPDFLSRKFKSNPNLNNNYDFNLNSFFHNLIFHPCLGKSLFISSKGNVYPCPMFRLNKWGNIKNLSLLNFLDENKNKIYDFWELNLDNIEKCNVCEFRYLCSDCRALEMEFDDISLKKNLCDFLNK